MSRPSQADSTYPSVKNTAGEGFAVEDRVGAWLACHLLAGIPWPNSQAGFLRAINCQMRQENWKFDDFVLEIDRDGNLYRCGCSVKSFPVFGKEGAPLDFTRAIWDEWRQKDGGPFDQKCDILALLCAPHEADIRESWQGLLDFARSVPPDTLAKRCNEEVEPSKHKRLAFKSVRFGGGDGTTEMDLVETARLLQRFHLQEQDFDHVDSQSVKQAQLMCQQALADAERSLAPDLWREILGYTAEVRNKGGRISLDSLLARLRGRFPLKHHPDYAAEWQRITNDSTDHLSALPTKIGGMVEIARESLLHSVDVNHEKKHTVALLGNSGNGKTVVAHYWVTGDPQAAIVWVRSADLRSGELRDRWSLTHDLVALFRNSSRPIRLVLDGLDKCFEEGAFTEAAMLLKAALGTVAGQCKIVLSCCPDDWERVQREFIRRGVTLECAQVPVNSLSDDELQPVREQLPQLRPLWLRPHLKPILRWPKALDIAVTYWRDTETPEWTSESDFARWFWQTAICQDNPLSNRGRVLRKLATDLADRLAPAIQGDAFGAQDLTFLRDLTRERLVTIDVVTGNVRIAHELIADWARLHELHAHARDAAELVRIRLQSAMWHRSLRFYALDLLENKDGTERWQQLFQEFSGTDPASEIARNLLLEAPIFALHQVSVLESLWSLFAADDGALLGRFLRQFLRIATLKFPRKSGQGAENPRKKSQDVHDQQSEFQELRS